MLSFVFLLDTVRVFIRLLSYSSGRHPCPRLLALPSPSRPMYRPERVLQDRSIEVSVCVTLLMVTARVRQFTLVLLHLLGMATFSRFSLFTLCYSVGGKVPSWLTLVVTGSM